MGLLKAQTAAGHYKTHVNVKYARKGRAFAEFSVVSCGDWQEICSIGPNPQIERYVSSRQKPKIGTPISMGTAYLDNINVGFALEPWHIVHAHGMTAAYLWPLRGRATQQRPGHASVLWAGRATGTTGSTWPGTRPRSRRDQEVRATRQSRRRALCQGGARPRAMRRVPWPGRPIPSVP
mgnify:CR=1 FL=1